MQLVEDIACPGTLADSVEKSILRYVQKEKLSPGDPLPKEEEIASKLNVSRHIVREGVSGLKTLGVIEARKRKGMFLRHNFNAFEGVRKLAEARFFSPEERRNFMHLRVAMELGMINYIWNNRTENDLQELRELASLHKCPTLEDEIAFHYKFLSMGKNPLANQFLDILTSLFDPRTTVELKEWTDATPTHIDICDVLENGTKTELLEVMEKHFYRYFN